MCLTKPSVLKDVSIIFIRKRESEELNFQGNHKQFPTEELSNKNKQVVENDINRAGMEKSSTVSHSFPHIRLLNTWVVL